jgi:hypothetical protein
MENKIKKRKKRVKKPITPRSKITNALRRVWLYSRERAQALRLQDRRCQVCGVRESKAKDKEQKIEVHHIDGIGVWKEIVDLVYAKLLVPPDKLECLCPKHHKERHEK